MEGAPALQGGGKRAVSHFPGQARDAKMDGASVATLAFPTSCLCSRGVRRRAARLAALPGWQIRPPLRLEPLSESMSSLYPDNTSLR